MKWHVTIETADAVHEFDLPVREAREGFIPLMRKIDALRIDQRDVVRVEMEYQDD